MSDDKRKEHQRKLTDQLNKEAKDRLSANKNGGEQKKWEILSMKKKSIEKSNSWKKLFVDKFMIIIVLLKGLARPRPLR